MYFLFFFLFGDFIFIILHYVNALTPVLNNDIFSIGIDNGFPEFYQYLKFASIIALLIYISKKTRLGNYYAWIALFIYFLIDDSIRIHDRFGGIIASYLDFIPPFGLRLLDVGELIVSLVFGVLLLLLIIWAFKSGNKVFKKVSIDFMLLVGILVFFGVGMDMIHMIIIEKTSPNFIKGVNSILGLFEDGGEMFAASIILWYTIYLKTHKGNPDCYLNDLKCIGS